MDDASGSLLGTNCTKTDEAAEFGKHLSQDRMCKARSGPLNPTLTCTLYP